MLLSGKEPGTSTSIALEVREQGCGTFLFPLISYAAPVENPRRGQCSYLAPGTSRESACTGLSLKTA